MGNYRVIADVGQAMVRLLRKFMVPEVVRKEGQIGLCHPKEHGEYSVAIYLYDVRESETMRNTPKRRIGEEQRKFPSVYLELYYMLVPYSRGDSKYRQEEEHKILGKMMQVLHDYPNLDCGAGETGWGTGNSADTVHVELSDLSYEDKIQVWKSLDEANHTALYCKVNPVELESERSEDIRRVREVQMQLEERGVSP